MAKPSRVQIRDSVLCNIVPTCQVAGHRGGPTGRQCNGRRTAHESSGGQFMSLSIRDRIDDIVALLQEAQLDESAWPAASALIDDTCGLAGNDLLLARLRPEGGIDIQLRWLLLRGEPNPELEYDYAENYAVIDERPAAGVREPFGKLVHTNALLSGQVRRDSVTYNEYLVPNGGENCLNVRMPGAGNSQIAWSLVGPGGGNPSDWSSERVDAIRQLLPHVRHFVRVRHALAEARADCMKTTASLYPQRMGTLILDRHGRVVEADERARTILSCSDGLTISGRRLTAIPPADEDGVARLIGAVCDGHQAGSMPIVRSSPPPLVLYATPLQPAGSPPWANQWVASVLIAEPFSAPTINARRVSAALGLTPAQARVAAALAAGETAASIAEATHRTEATVRWHIRAALSRLGLARQADLVRVVLLTPGVSDADRQPTLSLGTAPASSADSTNLSGSASSRALPFQAAGDTKPISF